LRHVEWQRIHGFFSAIGARQAAPLHRRSVLARERSFAALRMTGGRSMVRRSSPQEQRPYTDKTPAVHGRA
jgi:hypothetical protein